MLYDSPPGTRAGRVFVRHSGGEAAIWFVTGAASAHVTVHDLAYDGARFTRVASAAGGGSLSVQVRPTDGEVATGELSHSVVADEPVRLEEIVVPGHRSGR